jgi:monoamine oxidase
MPLGAALKAVLAYDKPFWREARQNGLVISSQGPVIWLYDNCWENASPAMLVGFITGRAATDLNAMSETERREAVLTSAVRSLGDQARQVQGYADWSWMAEEWSRGCYGTIAPPGVWTSTGQALCAPIGRIHWAGGETAPEWNGFMDGAITSGQRAAKEILAEFALTS